MVESTNTTKSVQLPKVEQTEENKSGDHEMRTMFGTPGAQFNSKIKELFTDVRMNELEK